MGFEPEYQQKVITQTQNWIRELVIGCNFCPFASREVKRDRVRYRVSEATTLLTVKEHFLEECRLLDKDRTIATTLLILPAAFPVFKDYLEMVTAAEQLLQRKKYEGIYQVAGFHPLYQFDSTAADDAANYTNRSIYPMLHILREADIRKALQFYPHPPEEIPERNINFAREKGTAYMKMLRDSCF
ncbi:MAG: DUF1415 domain-containing protein [Chitinophaga sp.]|uniref:DUF1415 domain-containing protein n=1 Tax=Chitinophaga sp. TaxID=1869181 RepID=UPI001B22C7B0|nr:DUF1415 domain-containing protein [Chitinophaga sp.]MBO9732166.1 DUF1415 domain-containing protein [Chitinophaga sp.]